MPASASVVYTHAFMCRMMGAGSPGSWKRMGLAACHPGQLALPDTPGPALLPVVGA